MANLQILIQRFIIKFTYGISAMSDMFKLDFNDSNYGQALIFSIAFLSFIISINILLGLINIFRKG